VRLATADYEGFDPVLRGGLLSRANTIGRAMVETSFFHLGERERTGRRTRDSSLNADPDWEAMRGSGFADRTVGRLRVPLSQTCSRLLFPRNRRSEQENGKRLV
jgi:hypothetical protein